MYVYAARKYNKNNYTYVHFRHNSALPNITKFSACSPRKYSNIISNVYTVPFSTTAAVLKAEELDPTNSKPKTRVWRPKVTK